MKHVLLLILVVSQFHLFAQGSNTYSIKKIVTQEKVFTGQINNKYDITMYLRFHTHSGEHQYIYSVKGYYYYDRVGTPIPIVGVYDGDLTLYVIDDAKQRDAILEFDSGGMNFWDQMTKLKNLDKYREKFVIQEGEMKWKSGEKELGLTIYQGDWSVLNEKEYLEVRDGASEYHINLGEIGLYEKNFTLVTSKAVNNEMRVLLKFDFNSMPNYNGMCGAGSEVGFIILSFNNQDELLKIDRVLIESCIRGIYSEYIPSANPTREKIYAIADENGKITNRKLDMERLEWVD